MSTIRHPVPQTIETVADLDPHTLGRLWTDYKLWAFKTSFALLRKNGLDCERALLQSIVTTADTSADPEQCSQRERDGFVRWFHEVRPIHSNGNGAKVRVGGMA